MRTPEESAVSVACPRRRAEVPRPPQAEPDPFARGPVSLQQVNDDLRARQGPSGYAAAARPQHSPRAAEKTASAQNLVARFDAVYGRLQAQLRLLQEEAEDSSKPSAAAPARTSPHNSTAFPVDAASGTGPRACRATHGPPDSQLGTLQPRRLLSCLLLCSLARESRHAWPFHCLAAAWVQER